MDLETVIQSANVVLRHRGYAVQIDAWEYNEGCTVGVPCLDQIKNMNKSLPDPVTRDIVFLVEQAILARNIEYRGKWSNELPGPTPDEVFSEINKEVLNLIVQYDKIDFVPNWKKEICYGT